ncbi:hypothetical protein KFU94_56155 [Chloroflexi bacterium TSY]|nr:hypothetical protein [Chloroflexi bacterium TSY]
MSEAEILTIAAAAEARQTHPIACAILAAATELNLPLPAIDEAHYEVGYGLKVRYAILSCPLESFSYREI